jgi:hypothetical protein
MKFTRFTVNSEKYTGVIKEGIFREIRGGIFGDWEYTGKISKMK